jgi:hypothetical protein
MGLPIVNVQLRIHIDNRWWKLKEIYGKINIRGKIVPLFARKEYTLLVELKEACGRGLWTIFLGLKQELQAMKTVKPGCHKVFLTFEAPDVAGESGAYYIMCRCIMYIFC